MAIEDNWNMDHYWLVFWSVCWFYDMGINLIMNVMLQLPKQSEGKLEAIILDVK